MENQHPLILPARGKSPVIDDSVWLAPNCTIVGEVTLGADSTVWFGAVVRGDVASITVGERVNIQDGAVIHGTYGKSQTVLEDRVSIGHNAIVHGARVCKGALIGMSAVVMDNVRALSLRLGQWFLRVSKFHLTLYLLAYLQSLEVQSAPNLQSI